MRDDDIDEQNKTDDSQIENLDSEGEMNFADGTNDESEDLNALPSEMDFENCSSFGENQSDSGLLSLVSSNNVYYERLPMLEIVFDRLVRLTTASLRNFTNDNVEVSLDTITSVRFGDYLNSIPNPAMVNVFIVEEWDNNGLITVDTDLIYSMVDILLGGRTGNALMRSDNRYFTPIELNLIEKLIQLFLADLSAAFDPLCPVTLRLERLETNPKFATISHPTNIAILVRLSVKMDGRGGSLELIIPYATLEPIREILLQNYMGEKFGRDSIWESHLVEQLNQTDLELSVILDEILLDLNDVIKWKVGSQIFLNTTPHMPVKLVCGSHPLFEGYVGRKAGNIAIKIDRLINVEED